MTPITFLSKNKMRFVIERPIKKAFFNKEKKAFYVLDSEENELLIFFGF